MPGRRSDIGNKPWTSCSLAWWWTNSRRIWRAIITPLKGMSYLCTYIIFFSAIPPQFCHASCLCQCEVSDGTFFPLWNGKWNCCNCKDYCWKLHVTFCLPFWMILNLFDECILPILRVIKSTLNGGLRLTFRISRKKRGNEWQWYVCSKLFKHHEPISRSHPLAKSLFLFWGDG